MPDPLKQSDPPLPALDYGRSAPDPRRLGTVALLLSLVFLLILFVTSSDLIQPRRLQPPLTTILKSAWIVCTVAGLALGALTKSHPDPRQRRRGAVAVALCIVSIPSFFACSWEMSTWARDRLQCEWQLKRIARGLARHARSHKGVLPKDLSPLIADQDLDPALLVCPGMGSNDEPATGADKQAILKDFSLPGRCSYRYFGAGMHWPAAAETILVCEPLGNHDDNGVNILYGNGVIRWVPGREAKRVLANLQARQGSPAPSSQPAGSAP